MKKKIAVLSLAIAIIAIAVVGGSLAWFNDTDEVTNTFIVGDIDIEQHEKDNDGNAFVQNQTMLPIVNTTAPSTDANYIDKVVTVENTGKNDAYVRTIVALEQGSIAADEFVNIIMTNSDYKSSQNNYSAHWDRELAATDVEIGETKYYIYVYTYCGPTSNPNGILAPGAASYPSLLQVYMKPNATNEDVEALDGNDNGKYDILVLSQAVQTAGFDDAQTALNTAFGEVNKTNLKVWFN